MDIRPVGGAGSAYPQPGDTDLANQLRSGIANFSKAIHSGNPESDTDLETLAHSITNLHSMTEKV